MQSKVKVVSEAEMELGEGPLWDKEEQALYWVDITQQHIHRYHPGSDKHHKYQVEQMIGAVVKEKGTVMVAALKNGFYRIDLANGQHTPLHDPEADQPRNRFNDGKCDAAGRFWAGTMSLHNEPESGALYCYHPDGRCVQHLTQVSVSNGIAWTKDNRTMYYIDTLTRKVVAFDYDLDQGELSNGRVIISIPAEAGFPDGMTIDAEDKLWICMWGGGAVLRYDPSTAKLLEKIEVPASLVTSCAFGGPQMDTLYITTASLGFDEQQRIDQPLAGRLFQLKTNTRGFPANRFGQLRS